MMLQSEADRAHAILVVDDDQAIRETIRDVLEAEGYSVLTAANGREGLDVLRTRRELCVILLDLMMPIMSGGEFLAALRQDGAFCCIPVVVVSAWAREFSLIKEPVQGFIKKPVQLDALLEHVERLCGPC